MAHLRWASRKVLRWWWPNLTLSHGRAGRPGLMEGVLGASPWDLEVPYVFN